MTEYSEVFVAFDTSKTKHAVAVAESGRDGEIRYLGEIESGPEAVERLVRKLAGRYGNVHFCYEAGPTGYGLYRQLRDLGHVCDVVAPSLIPQRPGDRVKTNRRDAVTLARLLRAGELTAVWVPDAVHEAVRDLTRAREAAMKDLRQKRQQLLSFLLRHGRVFTGHRHWSRAHSRWLAGQTFEHPAQQIVFQDHRDLIADAEARLTRLDRHLAETVPGWSMAPVIEAYQAMRGVSFLAAVTFVAEIGDGFSRVGAERTIDRRHSDARRPDLERQPAGSAGAGRRRLELPLPGPGQSAHSAPAGGAAQGGPGHRLESADPAVRPLSPAERRRQEIARDHCGDRPGNGGFPLGDRPTG
jgi:transposase